MSETSFGDPDPIEVLLHHARMYFDLGRYQESLRLYRRALTNGPIGTAHAMSARCLAALQHHEEALLEVERALALDADSEWYHRLRSMFLRRLGRYEEGLVAARAAVRCDPECASAHVTLAEASLDCGHIHDAVAAALRAVELDASSTEALNTLGHVREKTGDTEGAAAAFRRTLAIDAMDGYALAHLAELSELEEGIRLDRIALADDPTDTGQMCSLAEKLSRRGAHDEAIAVARTAVETDPDGYEHCVLTEVLLKAGRLDEAHRIAELAMERKSSDGWSWHARVLVAGARGDAEGVLAAAHQGLERRVMSELFLAVRKWAGLAAAADFAAQALLRKRTSYWLQVNAHLLAALGRFDEAIAVAQEATLLQDDYAWETFADVCAAAERPMELDASPAELAPATGTSVRETFRGHVSRARADLGAAEAHYRAALAADDYCCAAFGLALCLLKRGDLDGAAAICERGAERHAGCFAVVRATVERALRAAVGS